MMNKATETCAETRLVDIVELSKIIGVSDRTLFDHYRKYGMPHCRIGRSVRFDPVKCIQHFEQQASQQE